MNIFQGTKLATSDAVTTYHATAVIHGVRLKVDAGSLTVLRAQRTVLAFILVEVDLQP